MCTDLVRVRDGEDDRVEKLELLDVVQGQIPKHHATAAHGAHTSFGVRYPWGEAGERR